MQKTPLFEEPRKRIFENLGIITQTLASASRLRIVQCLTNSSCSVETLSQKTGESVANTSQHLQKLLKAGVVRCEKQGVSRIYHLSNRKVLELWLNLQDLARDLSPQIQQDEETICPADLLSELNGEQIQKKLMAGRAVLVDVREAEEAQSTPASGAISIPLQEFGDRWKELPKSKMILVFCRGRYCAMANPAVELLRKKGYEAFRLRENSYQLEKLTEAV